MRSWRAAGLGLVVLGLALARGGGAWAQPPEAAPTGSVVGHAEDAAGRAAEGVAVSVFSGGQIVAQARTDGAGDFNASGLPLMPPGSPSLILVARARAFAPCLALAPAPSLADEGGAALARPAQRVVLKMEEARSVRVLVANTAGQPVEGAEVTVPKVWVPSARSWPRQSLAWAGVGTQSTGADGAAVLEGLPSGAEAQLLVRRQGLASNVASVPFGRGEVSVPLSLAASLSGRVLLGDGTPLEVPAWTIKMQGWTEPWADYDNWRMGSLGKGGRFSVGNIPSLAILGEPTYGVNIDLADQFHPAPGLSAAYVPPGRGYNVLVTTEREGKTQRWISYVQGQNQGFKFEEGEQMHQDFILEPMALLRGKLPPLDAGRPQPQVSYHDPKSIYSDWKVTPAPDGSFEICLPVGDVTLYVGQRAVKVKTLLPHEVRQLDLTQPEAAG